MSHPEDTLYKTLKHRKEKTVFVRRKAGLVIQDFHNNHHAGAAPGTNRDEKNCRKTCFFLRLCLIIGSAPSGEGFFRQTRQKFAGILCGFQEFLTRSGGKRPADGCTDNFQTRPKLVLYLN